MAMSKGCTVALIVFGILFVIVVVVGILIWMNADKIKEAGINYLIDNTETEMLNNLPEGYTADYVSGLMAELKAALNANTLPPEKMQMLLTRFQEVMGGKVIETDETEDLLILIQDALGKEPPVIEEEIPDSLQAVPAGT